MKPQIKKLQTLLSQLAHLNEKAAQFANEEGGVGDEAHEIFTLEENTLREVAATAIELYLKYYDNDLPILHLGYLLVQVEHAE